MQWTNTTTKWGGVAQLFHWGMLLLIIGQYTLAYTMLSLPNSDEKFSLFAWHEQMGVTLFLLVFIRLWWREHSQLPKNIDTAPKWTQVLSKLNIWILYFLLFAFPLSGLLMTILGGHSVNYFNLFTIPALLQGPNEIAKILLTLHISFSYALYGFVGLHILGGFFHHFYLKDKVLTGMLPHN